MKFNIAETKYTGFASVIGLLHHDTTCTSLYRHTNTLYFHISHTRVNLICENINFQYVLTYEA